MLMCGHGMRGYTWPKKSQMIYEFVKGLECNKHNYGNANDGMCNIQGPRVLVLLNFGMQILVNFFL